ncbi:MAG: hypothetical protein ABH844_01410 [Candidatus Omnitrophota bacterium]
MRGVEIIIQNPCGFGKGVPLPNGVLRLERRTDDFLDYVTGLVYN